MRPSTQAGKAIFHQKSDQLLAWSRLIVWFAVLPFKLQLTPSPLVGGVRDSMESDCTGEGF